MNMFQIPDTDIELRSYLVQTMLAYAQMIKVFSAFIGELAVGLDIDAWNQQIDGLIMACTKESYKINSQINPEDVPR